MINRRRFLTGAAAVAIGCAAGCASTPAMTVSITTWTWNGWDPKHTPSPVTRTVPAALGAIGDLPWQVILTVTALDVGGMDFTSNKPLQPKSPGDPARAEFRLHVGQLLELHSPTLDAGWVYQLRLTRD